MQVMQVRKCFLWIWVVSLCLFTSSALQAQNAGNTASSEDVGPTASELISGRSNSISGNLVFDTSVGVNFTSHFGADLGVPYFLLTRPGIFAGTSGRSGYITYPYVGCSFYFGCFAGTTTSSRLWTGDLGDFYAMLHYTRTYNRYNFATVLTGDAPTSSYRKGMTTSRAQWDWFNHIDTDFHGVSPFVNFGLANGRMDQHFLPRPFNTGLPFHTFGYMADFEGGLQYKVWRRFNVGFSMWDVLPMGPQKIYSELVWQGASGSQIQIGSGGGITSTGPGTSGVPGQFGGTAGGGTGGTGVGGTGTGTGTGTGGTGTAGTGGSGSGGSGSGGGGAIQGGAGSRLVVFPGTGTLGSLGYLAGDPAHGRYWNSAFETVGPSFIARDNGYSATLAFSPEKHIDIQIGYNHSVRYKLDSVMFTVGLNANALFRKLTNY
jgi:hypothetical protein